MNKQNFIRAIKIAIIVGIILNLINQGEIIFNLAFEELNYYKFFLTFLVPFFVSMYTAIMMESRKRFFPLKFKNYEQQQSQHPDRE